MLDLPEHPTCTIRTGERAELKRDHVLMPDGSTRADLSGCTLEPGAAFFFEYDEAPRHTKPIALPDDVSPPAVPDSSDATAVVALPPEPTKMPPTAALSPVTVALAVGAAGTAGALGLRRLRAPRGAQVQTNAQQKEQERQRKECGTKSDTVLLDFKARTTDLKTRKLAQVVEPVELWRRADALEASAANLQRILRAMAKTRRA